MRRFTFLVLAVSAVAALAAPATSAAPIPAGGLNGVGCLSNPTDAALLGCTVGSAALQGLHEAALSPDGRQLYAVGEDAEDKVAGRIVTLSRNAATGGLSFSACLGPAADGCTADTHLNQPFGLELAPGGKDVYVADASRGVVHFRRAADGALTFESCVAPSVQPDCTIAPGLAGASGLAVSPDGESVYVAGYSNDAVSVLSRDPITGHLTFVECHTTGSAVGCTPLAGGSLGSATDAAVTADSARVYLSARGGASQDGRSSGGCRWCERGASRLAREP